MNGILFGDLLVKLLGTSFVCYSVPFYIDQILFMEKTDNRDVEKKQTKKLTSVLHIHPFK